MFNGQKLFQWLIVVVILHHGLQSLADTDVLNRGTSIFSIQISPYLVIKFLDDLFILYVCFVIFTNRLLTKYSPGKTYNKINAFVFSIVMVFIFSKIANQSPLINLLLASKYYFFGFLIYYLIMSIPHIDSDSIMKAYLAVIFIQLPLIMTQLAWSALYGEINTDTLAGTFHWANLLSYGMFCPLFYVGYVYLNGVKRERWRFLCFAVIMISGFGFYAILMFPLLFYVFNLGRFRYNARAVFRTALIIVVFLGLYGLTIEKVMPEGSIERHGGKYFLFSPRYLYEKLTVSEYDIYSGSARMLWFDVTSSKIDLYAYSPLIGMGPGMYASLAAYVLMPYTNQSIYNYFFQLQKGMDAAVDSQIIPLWGEVGYIGLALFVFFFLYCAVRYYRLSKNLQRLEDKALAISASAGSVYLLIGFYINHLLEVPQVILPLFLFMGLAERAALREMDANFESNEEPTGPAC